MSVMYSIKKTGWCWACGLGCLDLFCNPRCQKRYEREQAVQARRVERMGKRDGYGGAQSTH